MTRSTDRPPDSELNEWRGGGAAGPWERGRSEGGGSSGGDGDGDGGGKGGSEGGDGGVDGGDSGLSPVKSSMPSVVILKFESCVWRSQ